MTKTEARAQKAAEEVQRVLDARTSSVVSQLIAELRAAGVRIDDEEPKS